MRLAALLVLVPAIAHGDVIDEKGVRVGGIFTGLQHDTSMPIIVDGIDVSGGGSRPELGFAIGTFVVVRATPWFAVQLEAQLQQQRFELHQNNEMPIGHARAWCVELPVLARFDTLKGERTKLYLVGGPSIVLSAGGEIKLDAGGTASMDEIQPVNAALALGIGVEWTAGPGRIVVDARYRGLLQPFTKNSSFFQDRGETGQNIMFQLFAGYAFP